MIKYVVVNNCYCEHYLHEVNNYPRKGLKELKLYEGDIVEFVENFHNFYGSYIRVRKGDDIYDILPENLEEVR